jgi:hypothetical protein
MATTVPARLEVRLDPEHRKKLAQLAAEHHQPISEIIRQMIDKAYEDEVGLRERRAALQSLLSQEPLPVPDDPQELHAWYDRTKYARVDESLARLEAELDAKRVHRH